MALQQIIGNVALAADNQQSAQMSMISSRVLLLMSQWSRHICPGIVCGRLKSTRPDSVHAPIVHLAEHGLQLFPPR